MRHYFAAGASRPRWPPGSCSGRTKTTTRETRSDQRRTQGGPIALRHRWRNWGGTLDFEFAALRTPNSIGELQSIVREASERGLKIRPVGSGHSWSPLVETADLLISLDRLHRTIRIDREKRLATFQAGTSLRKLNKVLAMNGLALPVLGSIDRQTLAGVVSTATHGTGIRHGNLSDLVVELELITGTGELIRCSRDKEPEVFAAAACGLGCIGILTEVTLPCESAFRLQEEQIVLSFSEAIDRLDEFVDGADHFKIWWLPHTEQALCIFQNRTNRPLKRAPVRTWMEQYVVRNALFKIGMGAASRYPPFVPRFQRALARLTPSQRETVDLSHRIFNLPALVRHLECEYAIPRQEGPEVLRRLHSFIRESEITIGFIVEIRFTAQDEIFLSPTFGRESCYIGVMQYPRLPSEEYFKGFESIVDEFGGRPHWGKVHFKGASQLKGLYPMWERFLEVRHRLDPDRIFMNGYLERLLGIPVG